MRVFLTGASGFVGSHILDLLCAEPPPVLPQAPSVGILLRHTSNTRFVEQNLPRVRVHYGSLTNLDSLVRAVEGADCVIHCAGKTKVLNASEFYQANREGTRNVVEAVNEHKATVKRLILISSLAVSGPAGAAAPVQEDAPPQPVSHYGRSKLQGELEVTERCEVPYTVLRPSAVYGPRDTDFLFAFRAVKARVMPLVGGGRMDVSLVYVGDVARAVLCCLGRPEAAGRVYHVAAPEPCTSEEFFSEIARRMRVKAVPIELPGSVMYPVCVAQEILSRITGRPSVLSRERYRELKQPGWVCSTDRIGRELGFVAGTSLPEGVALTLDWYRRHGWL